MTIMESNNEVIQRDKGDLPLFLLRCYEVEIQMRCGQKAWNSSTCFMAVMVYARFYDFIQN